MSVVDVDATRAWSVAVIAEDREHHVRCSPSRCVGANAVNRQRGVLDARVGAGTMRVLRKGRRIRYALDTNTEKAVKAYDEAGEVMPIGFVFRFVPPPKPIGSRKGEKPGSDRRSGKGTSVATRKPSHRHIDVEPV